MGKLNFFKRSKVDNAIDQDACIVLPKSGREITIETMVSEADAAAIAKKKNEGNEGLADPTHKVKLHDGTYCNVGELLEKHKAMHDELEEMKAKKDDAEESEGELETEGEEVDVEGDDKSRDDDDDDMGGESMDDAEDPAEDEGAKKKALELAEHEDKEIEAAKKKKNAADAALKAALAKKKNAGKDGKGKKVSEDELAARRAAKEKAERLRNAHHKGFEPEEVATVELMADQVQRGKSKYGSN